MKKQHIINETFLDEILAQKLGTTYIPPTGIKDADFEQAAKHFINLLLRADGLKPIKTAVVHPIDKESLLGAVRAAQFNVIKPVLIGPQHKIESVAKVNDVDLENYQVINAEHSHEAAKKAVELAKKREVSAIMKGALHTDELMSAVVYKENGLRTERRISHAFLMAVATFPKPFIITDAAINIRPTLEDKRDIVQNAIDLMHMIKEDKQVRVAVLSAVETVTSAIPTTLDAAALSKMADRGQIMNAIVDGPLAFDNAISLFAAEAKGINSPVSGNADILVAPDLESGNLLAKQLKYLGQAVMAGIVLGARVPIILTSRADPIDMRVISCVLASFIYNQTKAKLHIQASQ
ncbi:phosphate acetyltransferase [Rickettsia typhi]|uniref:Phosphate acetyltransferase n=2 Tax=Rickettsia typhi TaxID=785 RepID=PTAS_RICTY|nr:phosphate acetyltransferase [Rickettsia typhi]Q68XX7.1 RecName: Full=Phosphate acetyltransferase; AltName: Full=Phosphotransacetylase [Rickettsia typhi str. Wilmington]AAU03515.1 Phosphoacylase [Rickettsia typhi str. Wilmington]AFE53892.1 phosphate acetyltransferase [Rickettsia typhi str. TH1527]AFE54730.1 phosphate acetyltransferase [Rickettsia typhi str. B9991CWPP]